MLQRQKTQSKLLETDWLVKMRRFTRPLTAVVIALRGILVCLLGLGFSCTGLYMQNLPINVLVIDAESRNPVSDATVELWWRTGFGGIYWGKPVVHAVDSNGVARFTSENIPPLDELGGKLKGGNLKKLMVEGWIVNAPEYQPLVLRPTSNKRTKVLELLPQKGSEKGSPIRGSGQTQKVPLSRF